MAVKPCPSCGSSTTLEARFCRVCGAPVKAFDASDGQVSPQAQTIPLTDEARSTDGLHIEERRQTSAETSRISRTEVDKLLQRRRTEEQAGDDGVGGAKDAPPAVAAGQEEASVHDADYAAPVTGSLQTPPAAVASASQTSSTPPTAARGKSRVWLTSLAAFALIALLAGLLGYYLFFSARSRRASESEAVTPAQKDEPQQQAQTASEETGVGPAVNPQPSPAPSPALNATTQANNSEAERASHTQAERSRAAEANTSQSSSPPPQVSPTLAPPKPAPQPTPATLAASDHYRRGVELWNSNRQAAVTEFRVAAQSNPDAYYYLGLNIAEGRDPHSLLRAELVAALEYFQRAQSGPHRAEATRYVDRLSREFDRRRKQ